MDNDELICHCEGACGCCGSLNLEFGTIEIVDDSIYYPFTCLDCGADGKEWYDLKYSETRMNQ